MSSKNNSQKPSGSQKPSTNTKGLVSIKGGANTKEKQTTKNTPNTPSSKPTKNAQAGSQASSPRAEATPAASIQRSFHPSEIRSLIQNHGRAKVGGSEWALKTPSWNDSALQAIINDPQFTAKPTGSASHDGKQTYELRGHGKKINVTIGH